MGITMWQPSSVWRTHSPVSGCSSNPIAPAAPTPRGFCTPCWPISIWSMPTACPATRRKQKKFLDVVGEPRPATAVDAVAPEPTGAVPTAHGDTAASSQAIGRAEAAPLDPIEFFPFEPDTVSAAATVQPTHPPHADALEFTLSEPTVTTPAASATRTSVRTEITGLTSIPEGIEPDLLDIFLEEAGDVLATMGEAADACQNNPDDQESLTVIRRAFHTLKGSGRMVGLSELGETAWHLEQLMNGWLAESKAASSDLLRLLGHARGVFQEWVIALQERQPTALPVSPLLAAVERVAQGQPFDTESLADNSAPAFEGIDTDRNLPAVQVYKFLPNN